jgi:Trypsin-like peptidase domain
MKPRYPESIDERAARLAGAFRRMRLPGEALESSQLTLPPANVVERRIAARLIKASRGDRAVAEVLAGKMAIDGFNVARSLIAGEIDHTDLHTEAMANLEAVIHVIGRPAWYVRNDAPQTEEIGADQAADEFWITQIVAAQEKLLDVCARVGCIMVEDGAALLPRATGWLIGKNTIVTNAHVAPRLALQNPSAPVNDPRGGWRLRPDRRATVDFAFENKVHRQSKFAIEEVMYVEDSGNPDIAVFRHAVPEGAGPSPSPLQLDLQERPGGWNNIRVFVAGHPIRDLQDDDNVAVVFGEIDGTKRFSPGYALDVLGTDVLAHDCSTTNGSSGSPLVDFASLKAVGLHYYGGPGERNEAVLLSAIADHPAILKCKSGDWGF